MAGKSGGKLGEAARKAADEAAISGPRPGVAEGPRNILLFSDGTGNSSSSSDKTNVWRLYEALDLGYPVKGASRVQIAYYDNGVGTSSVRLLAILGGVFGFGLARNICDIYKFLCRNYRPGDSIYAFGFSRGAYTIRLLIAFVTQMGLVTGNQDEGRLDFAARDNWREFRKGFHANLFLADFLVGLGRECVRWIIICKRILFCQPAYAAQVKGQRRSWISEWWEYTADRLIGWWTGTPPIRERQEFGPPVEFVGVWDTVAAYGGPVVEITRAIDEWIWPLTMPDYRLSAKVKCARHALAIDDKRDSFTPLLWDEIAEKSRPDYNAENPRLQQVWFAGMHADVGGGYPDESLSYVSLWWMLQHAEKAGPGGVGARFLKEPRKTIEAFRNVYGPLHDSRGGAGAFYRYQPRYINAWVEGRPGKDGILKASRIFRDPTIDHGRYRDHGLLNFPVRVHVSVQERLQVATDAYAPNNLPARYIVDHGTEGTEPSAARILEGEELVNFKAGQFQLGDRIKIRRGWYFLSALLFALFMLKPLWGRIPVLKWVVGAIDVRTNAHQIEQAANAFLPAAARTWTAAIAADPFVSLATIGLILLTARLGVQQEHAMAAIAGRQWRERLKPTGFVLPPAQPGLFSRVAFKIARQFHTFEPLAKALALLKWRTIPILLGLVIWIFNWYLAALVAAQAYLVPRESWQSTCPSKAAPVAIDAGVESKIRGKMERPADEQIGYADVANPCNNTGIKVIRGKRYRVLIDTFDADGKPGGWLDEGQAATPTGWSDDSFRTSWFLAITRPFQRVTTVPLFQPILEVRSQSSFLNFHDIYMMRPELKNTAPNRWEGHFIVPTRDDKKQSPPAPLYFFVNDAVIPFDRMAVAGQVPQVRAVSHENSPVVDTCGPAKGGSRVPFTLSGRYRNNCGKALIRVHEEEFEVAE